MRILSTILLASALTACGSSPEGLNDPGTTADTGSASTTDTGSASDSGHDSGSQDLDAGVDSAHTPDTGAASDTAPGETASSDTGAAATDTGPGFDASDPDAQRTACYAGLPRLSWTGSVCVDNDLATTCRFEPTSAGVRCVPLPIAAPAGFMDPSCPLAFRVLTDYTTFTSSTHPKYVTIAQPDGTYAAHMASTTATPSAGWYLAGAGGSCVEQTTAFPYGDGAGDTLVATAAVDPTTLVDAP